MSHLALLSLVAASQGFILMLVFLRLEHGNKLANRILSCFIGVQTVRLLTYYFLYEEAFTEHSWVYLAMNLNLAAGPLIFLYIQSLTTSKFTLHWWMGLHFLPMVLYITGASIWVNTYGWEVSRLRSWLWESQIDLGYDDGDEFYDLTILLGIIYGGLACRLLWRHSFSIRHQFSSLESINLRWVWLILGLYVGGSVLGGVRDLLMVVMNINFGPRMLVALLASVAQIYLIAYKGMGQRAIYWTEDRRGTRGLPIEHAQEVEMKKVVEHEKPAPVVTEDKSKRKYLKSGLTTERSEELWVQLRALMDKKSPFLDSDLSLSQLAKLMSLSNDHLTQVINNHSKKNFYDFINDYRIEAAKRLLVAVSDKPRSLLHIALDCGFNSQSTFSTRFKRETGETPSQFRRSAKSG